MAQLRVSLRSLLLGTALVCAMFAWLSVRRNQQAALNEINGYELQREFAVNQINVTSGTERRLWQESRAELDEMIQQGERKLKGW